MINIILNVVSILWGLGAFGIIVALFDVAILGDDSKKAQIAAYIFLAVFFVGAIGCMACSLIIEPI